VATPAYESDRTNCAWYADTDCPNSPQCQVSLHASVSVSHVCSDSESIVTMGTRKNTSSQMPAGPPRR